MSIVHAMYDHTRWQLAVQRAATAARAVCAVLVRINGLQESVALVAAASHDRLVLAFGVPAGVS